MQKIERLLAITLALNKNKKMTAKELAETFEVDIRTIYRDMQALSEMNIPVVSYPGSEGGYEILDSYYIPPIMFTKDEVFSLLLAKKIVDIVDIPGYTGYSNSAFLKIESLVCDRFKKDFEDVEKRIVFDIKTNDIEIKNSHIFHLIKQALKDNLKMKINYTENNYSTSLEQIIRPYGIVFEDGIWYMVALSELTNERTHFNIERIKDASLLDEAFDFPEDFNMRSYYSTTCFKNASNSENSIALKIKIKKELYPSIKDYVFFKYGTVEEKSDHYIINIRTTKPDFYINLAFRFFNGMEILEPQWVREKLKEEIKKLTNTYGL